MQKTSNGKLRYGDELNDEQLEALRKTGLTGNQVLDNIDNLNEEIIETVSSSGEKLPEHNIPKVNRKLKRGNQQMSLDAELDKINQELDKKIEQQVKQEVEEEIEAVEEAPKSNSIKEQVLDLLKNSKDAPSDRQIAAWKAKHGKNSIYAIGMGEGDVYVFTHLKRGQWKKIQEIIGKMSKANETFDAQDEMKKKVVQYCTLFPGPLPLEFFYNSRAGVLDALYEAILLNSYFLTPQQTMMLTTQL